MSTIFSHWVQETAVLRVNYTKVYQIVDSLQAVDLAKVITEKIYCNLTYIGERILLMIGVYTTHWR